MSRSKTFNIQFYRDPRPSWLAAFVTSSLRNPQPSLPAAFVIHGPHFTRPSWSAASALTSIRCSLRDPRPSLPAAFVNRGLHDWQPPALTSIRIVHSPLSIVLMVSDSGVCLWNDIFTKIIWVKFTRSRVRFTSAFNLAFNLTFNLGVFGPVRPRRFSLSKPPWPHWVSTFWRSNFSYLKRRIWKVFITLNSLFC